MYVFQIIVGYRPTKKYTLTPSRKKIGKAVDHGSKKALAKQCMEDPVTKRHLFDLVGLSLRREMKVMVSDSTNSLLKSQEVEQMKSFSWASVLDELTNNAPTLLFSFMNAQIQKEPFKHTCHYWSLCSNTPEAPIKQNECVSEDGVNCSLCWTYFKVGNITIRGWGLIMT